MAKTSIITGITGQDGSYLAENLLNKGHNVIGLYRRSSSNNFDRILSIKDNNRLILEEFDITDPSDCTNIIIKYRPNEFYNLAAQSHVGTSFKQPTTTFEINAVGVINILEAIKRFSSTTRFYQASTSEMFGSNYVIKNNEKYQDENTPFLPQSPYAVSKLSSHRMVQIYREAYGLYTCSGILFNHESPRRGENFVTRKITLYLGKLVNKIIPPSTKLKLGNLSAVRDWGHAIDYVEAMRLMLNADKSDDYVISSGSCYSVEQFLEKAFGTVGLNYQDYYETDPELYRPAEVNFLRGDSSKAHKKLLWKPSYNFDDLVKDMVYSDIKKYAK
jgi:GDPmannose 4,6-dehydratase